jgi:hypothetical protein
MLGARATAASLGFPHVHSPPPRAPIELLRPAGSALEAAVPLERAADDIHLRLAAYDLGSVQLPATRQPYVREQSVVAVKRRLRRVCLKQHPSATGREPSRAPRCKVCSALRRASLWRVDPKKADGVPGTVRRLERADDDRVPVDDPDDLRADRLRALRGGPSATWLSARARKRVTCPPIAVGVEAVRVARPSSLVEVLRVRLAREVGAVAILSGR